MKKRTKIILAVIAAAAVIALACFFIFRDPKKSYAGKSAEQIVAKMSTDEKIGQILMPSFRIWRDHPEDEAANVTALNDEIRAMIADYHIGGVDLFSENSTDISQLLHLTYDMQHSAIDAGNLPLLILTDQEGGNVSRAKFGTLFSGNMALGASGDPENAYTVGTIIGKELNTLGINCNCAPDADVNSNEQNPIIGIRAFSGDVDTVSEMTVAIARGFEDSHVINCVKHFPGHGDTSTDTHTGLSSVDKSYDEWLAADGAPFKAAIESGVTDMIMTAHLQYPGLDGTAYHSSLTGEDIVLPATMSETILTDILKGDLGFEGVIITDAMNMGAIEQYFGLNEATVKSIAAGADMILMSVNPTCKEDRAKFDSLFADIKAALADGTITEERLNDAALRVVKLKLNKGVLAKDYDFDPDEAAEKAKTVVGCPEHRAIERQIALKCVDVSYTGEFTPFAPKENDKVVCVMTRPADMYSAEHSVLKMQERGIIPKVDAVYYNVEEYWNADEDKAFDEQMLRDIENADWLIVGYYRSAEAIKEPENKINLVFDEILEYAPMGKTAILWERLPYGVEQYNDRYPCILLYNSAGMTKADVGKDSFTGQYGCAIPAGFEILFGVTP